jgi:hypothetical protein
MPAVVQAAGVGPLRANTMVTNWADGPSPLLERFDRGEFSRNLRTAFRLGSNLLVLDVQAEEWRRLDERAPADRIVDVWWTPSGSGRLALLLAYLMTRDADWKDAAIRVLVAADEAAEEASAPVRELLADARIEADLAVVRGGVEVMVDRSQASDVVFLPFAIHSGRFYHALGGEIGELLPRLPVVALTLAAQDIDLAADPDAGPGAERARAQDKLDDARRRLKRAEDAASKAAEAAAHAAEALAEARRKQADTSALAEHGARAENALAAAEAAARRLRRARSLAQGREAFMQASSGVKGAGRS